MGVISRISRKTVCLGRLESVIRTAGTSGYSIKVPAVKSSETAGSTCISLRKPMASCYGQINLKTVDLQQFLPLTFQLKDDSAVSL